MLYRLPPIASCEKKMSTEKHRWAGGAGSGKVESYCKDKGERRKGKEGVKENEGSKEKEEKDKTVLGEK